LCQRLLRELVEGLGGLGAEPDAVDVGRWNPAVAEEVVYEHLDFIIRMFSKEVIGNVNFGKRRVGAVQHAVHLRVLGLAVGTFARSRFLMVGCSLGFVPSVS
jgi:hypothetical protein